MSKAYILFNNQSANDTSEVKSLEGKANGSGVDVILSGGFGGGTLSLEYQSPNFDTQWIPIDGFSFTAPVVRHLVRTSQEMNIRAVLSGATGASLNVEITQ